MRVDRRGFLFGIAGTAIAASTGRPVSASAGPPGLFVSCAANREGGYCVSGFDGSGETRFTLPLPARGHAVTFHPGRPECVVFARRPGAYFLVLDCERPAAPALVENVAGRRFQGHGTFSADGRYLFASENDYEAGRGVLGVYDSGSAYRRIGEMPSHGVGPHDLRLLPDGERLVVANGGIHTHPDYGRAKLNIATMDPNLAIVEVGTGALLDQVRLPRSLHKLSIRHLDVSRAGHVAVAMQYEGDRRDRVPLVGYYPGGGALALFRAPSGIERRMRHYTGSIAFDETERFVAASCPKGHLVTLWDVESGTLLHAVETPDSSGVAAAGQAGTFLVAGGDGRLRRIDARSGDNAVIAVPATGIHWDNHLEVMPRSVA